MQEKEFDRILEQIGRGTRLSAAQVRQQMQQALNQSLSDPDPAVQKMWKAVPCQGAVPTLEEFMEYLIRKNVVTP